MSAVLDRWSYHETIYKLPQLKLIFTVLNYMTWKKTNQNKPKQKKTTTKKP